MKLRYVILAVVTVLLGVVAYKGYGIYKRYHAIAQAAAQVQDVVRDPGKVLKETLERQLPPVPKVPDLATIGGLLPLPQAPLTCPVPQALPRPIVPKPVVVKPKPKPAPARPKEEPKVFPPVNPDPDDDIAAALFGR